MIEHINEHIIRAATSSDTDAILAFDLIAQGEPQRQAFIRQAIVDGACTAAVVDGQAVGYVIMKHIFFGNPFIELLYVQSEYRRYGFGVALMQHIEATCGGEKLFTSTNLSNLRMQRLLEKLGYTISGVVHNLDEGDPEVFYFKRLTQSVPESGYNTAQLLE